MLPIESVYNSLIDTLKLHSSVLLQAPPGAGKSTWLPLKMVRDGHFKHIIMLEPRRLAARNIASFLASQQQESIGASIGLRIRNEVKVSADTRLEIVTEGVLTRRLQNDPELTGVDLVIFDEFHERSMAADTALALALETQAAFREDLKLLVMSATLDTHRYQAFLECPIVVCEGRSFPVDTIYTSLANETRWLDAVAPLIRQALQEQDGSVLVFLPGQKEITHVAQSLAGYELSDTEVAPLYGNQDKRLQQAAIAPAKAGYRKVVLTTNVAETSLTIEGIRVVIDSGKRKVAQFNLKSGVTELVTASISRSSAVQRAGRAGRIEAGVVYRLGSHEQFERREGHDTPEILSSDISGLLFEAKVWGSDIRALPLLDHPSEIQIQQATQLLKMLEILDNNEKLTTLGQKIHQFGTEPRLAHMLVKAQQLETEYSGISTLACYLVALIESRVTSSPELRVALQAQFERPTKLFSQQLMPWLKRLRLTKPRALATEHLDITIALAFPDRLAKRRGQGFVLANGAGVNSHESHWLGSDYIAIASLGGHKGQRIFNATDVSIEQLLQALPHLFTKQSVCEFDEKKERFLHEDRTLIGNLVIEATPSSQKIDVAARTQAWLMLIEKYGLKLFKDYDTVLPLLTRMALAQRYSPLEFVELDEQSLLDNIATWLAPYLSDIKQLPQLKKFALKEAILSKLDWQQQQRLDVLLPKKITVPSGSNITIDYQIDGPAKLSVRMQEVYGLVETPKLYNGQLPLLMELLSPARRPLQLTQDLRHFWQSSYKDVQKEMKGRYPKHFWPDDPANAQATNRVKSRM
ncbi:ATP-dependent helicase HrpB [Pseudoalteromonas sp. MMG012]|uniref:ATP-dependent helicase HrpB n=1 Tax=Pseudoalteromonas sp. MMG012 TaxID=2822686 RepID=UPI001B39F741|nr:ATP-dependent helicase HrpB [Pseudoalteromonas sp. MMG012]MBQ4851320.1 ATP-dependent helicase HrpB [Pseudoalteromonas sp. MMG012]